MSTFQLLLDKVHQGKNPYTDFPTGGWAGTWYGDPGAQRAIFDRAIERTAPGVIVEVGSFVGESAIHMAKQLRARRLDAAILCVDTWYAGFDHWLGAREKIQMHFGRPDLYYKFVANVLTHEVGDWILPLAMDSIGAARVLKWMQIPIRLVYIDASHEQGDVGRDYEAYWDLLPSGAGMLVDDLSGHFPGVLHDWGEFVLKHNLKPVLTEGEKSLVIKP